MRSHKGMGQAVVRVDNEERKAEHLEKRTALDSQKKFARRELKEQNFPSGGVPRLVRRIAIPNAHFEHTPIEISKEEVETELSTLGLKEEKWTKRRRQKIANKLYAKRLNEKVQPVQT